VLGLTYRTFANFSSFLQSFRNVHVVYRFVNFASLSPNENDGCTPGPWFNWEKLRSNTEMRRERTESEVRPATQPRAWRLHQLQQGRTALSRAHCRWTPSPADVAWSRPGASPSLEASYRHGHEGVGRRRPRPHGESLQCYRTDTPHAWLCCRPHFAWQPYIIN